MAASGLRKSYHLDGSVVEVLKGVDLLLLEGGTAAILGPSGAGKSTLLHLLGLLEPPDEGDYLLSGENVLTLPDQQKAAIRLQKVGFVFQFHHLLSEFSAIENVMLPALMRGLNRTDAEERAGGLLESVGLGQRFGHKPGELSGGEQQRTALARALVNEPALILADEPTGNLDQQAAMKMKELLWRVCADRGAAVILVTHNRALADEAQLILEMRDGRLDPA